MPSCHFRSLSVGHFTPGFQFQNVTNSLPSPLRKPTPAPRCFTDLLVFVTIVFVARRAAGFTVTGIPSLLVGILKDATIYFMLIFTSQLVVGLFLVFAPVSHRTALTGFYPFLCLHITGWAKVTDFILGIWIVERLPSPSIDVSVFFPLNSALSPSFRGPRTNPDR